MYNYILLATVIFFSLLTPIFGQNEYDIVSDRKINSDAYLYTEACAAILLGYYQDSESGSLTTFSEREYSSAFSTCNQNVLYFYDYCNVRMLSYCNDQTLILAMENYIYDMGLQNEPSPSHYLDYLAQ